MAIPNHHTNYAVWIDGLRLLGMADLTLPNLANLADDLRGAGIGGNINMPVQAHFDAMSVVLNFHTPTEDIFMRLGQQDGHNLDIRAATQYHSSSDNKITQQGWRFVMTTVPKGINLGTLEVGAKGNASVELEVITIRVLKDERALFELDKENIICRINGVDYGARIRHLLGIS